MISTILDGASEKIAIFNSEGLHYNIVSEAIQRKNELLRNPFDPAFLSYIIAGLISFDMGRSMGKKQYSREQGFAFRLNYKLQQIRPLIEPIINFNLLTVDLDKTGEIIKKAFVILSERGSGGLHSNHNAHFYVGATKILHFLNPNLFIIIDSNAARAFRLALKLPFKKSTQPGFSAELYLECMKRVKSEIFNYGLNRFQSLEPYTPITRIYDKLTFVTGSKLLN